MVEFDVFVTEHFLDVLHGSPLPALGKLDRSLHPRLVLTPGPDLFLVVLDEVADFTCLQVDWLPLIKFFGLDVLIKQHVLVHSPQIIEELVLESPELSFFGGGELSPLIDLQLQVINGFFGLEHQLLQPLTALALSTVLIRVLLVLLHFFLLFILLERIDHKFPLLSVGSSPSRRMNLRSGVGEHCFVLEMALIFTSKMEL
eukprot:CAMPEP_0170548632 /NCGR_PEP_ID=MMETSP0211-20121228/6889_1 /TAXON_ID=311385 /ORGANISM="Pseudokeronopsis sp., Strain OXSARD2" /LENGTH=200 /DNA_ID=CAMNT_0010854243 /DNA_START=884 /DNA_END=1487 /DNA_ORIENTATION=-